MTQTARFWVTGPGAETFIGTLAGLNAPAEAAQVPINEALSITLQAGPDPDTPHGIILLLDPADASEVWPRVQALPPAPTIIAVTDPGAELRRVRDHLPENTPLKVFPCDLHARPSAENVLLALIYQMLSRG